MKKSTLTGDHVVLCDGLGFMRPVKADRVTLFTAKRPLCWKQGHSSLSASPQNRSRSMEVTALLGTSTTGKYTLRSFSWLRPGRVNHIVGSQFCASSESSRAQVAQIRCRWLCWGSGMSVWEPLLGLCRTSRRLCIKYFISPTQK